MFSAGAARTSSGGIGFGRRPFLLAPYDKMCAANLHSDRWPRDISFAAGKIDKKWECSRSKASPPP